MWIKIYSRAIGLQYLEQVLPRLEIKAAIRDLLKYRTYTEQGIEAADNHHLIKSKRLGLMGLRKYLR